MTTCRNAPRHKGGPRTYVTFPSLLCVLDTHDGWNVRLPKRIGMASLLNNRRCMAPSRKIYAALLAAVFVFGGLLGPVLHFASHAVGADHHHDATWHEGPHATDAGADFFACDLCDFHLLAAPVDDAADGALLRPTVPALKAPDTPHFSSVDLPLSRAPPAGA